jgi:hypothetical protein
MKLYRKIHQLMTTSDPLRRPKYFVVDRLSTREKMPLRQSLRCSTSINTRINVRAGLHQSTHWRDAVSSFGIVAGKRPNGSGFYWRAYGVDRVTERTN